MPSPATASIPEVLSPWLSSATDSVLQVSETALGFVMRPYDAEVAREKLDLGAFVPVLAPGESVQIGLVADDATCAVLAAGLLQEPDPSALSHSDITDALGEITNMVAGMTKAKLSGELGVIALGLPMIVRGHLEPTDSTVIDVQPLHVGERTALLLVIRPKT
jgi:hypothetical protein